MIYRAAFGVFIGGKRTMFDRFYFGIIHRSPGMAAVGEGSPRAAAPSRGGPLALLFLYDLVHHAIRFCFFGGQPEVAVGVFLDPCKRLAGVLREDLIQALLRLYDLLRGYLDFERLYVMHREHATFITRIKSNTQYLRLYSRPVDKTTGLRCDQTIVLTGVNSIKNYPEQLRLVKFFDSEHKKYLKFLTNNFEIDALTVAQLYKHRWQVELFFRWIKQHLRIKTFFGTSKISHILINKKHHQTL